MKREYQVELPNTDALRIFRTIKEAFAFLDTLGVKEYYLQGTKFIVPEFAAGRVEYSRVKQIECDRWGSN